MRIWLRTVWLLWCMRQIKPSHTVVGGKGT